jgi:MFS family permease
MFAVAGRRSRSLIQPARSSAGPLRGILALPELRAFLAAIALASLAEGALTVLLGVNVYELTHRPLDLGWLGLAEAIPAIGLVLVGGHVADRASRRMVTIACRLGIALLSLVLALFASASGVWLLFAVACASGGVRAFEDPAATGLETQILPREHMMEAISLVASAARIAGMLGPLAGGVLYAAAGPGVTYAAIAAVLAASGLITWLGIGAKPAPEPPTHSMRGSIAEGLRFVFNSQVIVGSMALDLFAVFFGGVTGLLPVFADDVLHTGPAGVGLLRAASSAGALVAMLIATRHPPKTHAGVVLHVTIAGFGVGIIVFGLSTSLPLSLAALAFAGACDGTSVVVRRAIVRIAAPDALRGRVAAVRGLFLNASNELGSFESGVAASLVGTVPAVWLGGVITLVVVVATAWRAPELLGLDLGRDFSG